MANRYAALIRGINLGRARRVSMADLRAVFEGLGFKDCRTLLNSGNVVFTGAGASTAIGPRIERQILAELGLAARVIVLAAGEFATVVEENSLPRAADDPTRVLVQFVAKAADLKRLKEVESRRWSPEVLVVGTRAAYLWCPAGVGKSPLWQAVGRVAGDGATARNWATVKKLQALLL